MKVIFWLALALVTSSGLAADLPTPPEVVEQKPALLPSANAATQPTMPTVTYFKELANILFFVVVSVVTVLTYLQARRTIFMPLRTESFKLQIRAFEEILAFFHPFKDGVDDEKLDYLNILSLNAKDVLIGYSVYFFPGHVPGETIKRLVAEVLEETVGYVTTGDAKPSRFHKVTPGTKPVQQEVPSKNPAIALAAWEAKAYDLVRFTKPFHDTIETVERFASSPLVPDSIKRDLLMFARRAEDNVSIMGDVLTEISKELPSTLQDPDKIISDSNFSWIWNRFNQRRMPLLEMQQSILDGINKHLNLEAVNLKV